MPQNNTLGLNKFHFIKGFAYCILSFTFFPTCLFPPVCYFSLQHFHFYLSSLITWLTCVFRSLLSLFPPLPALSLFIYLFI